MAVLAGMPSSRAASRLVKPSGTVARTRLPLRFRRTPGLSPLGSEMVPKAPHTPARSDGRPLRPPFTPAAVISLHDSFIPQRGPVGIATRCASSDMAPHPSNGPAQVHLRQQAVNQRRPNPDTPAGLVVMRQRTGADYGDSGGSNVVIVSAEQASPPNSGE